MSLILRYGYKIAQWQGSRGAVTEITKASVMRCECPRTARMGDVGAIWAGQKARRNQKKRKAVTLVML
jgi:hypothetical protein